MNIFEFANIEVVKTIYRRQEILKIQFLFSILQWLIVFFAVINIHFTVEGVYVFVLVASIINIFISERLIRHIHSLDLLLDNMISNLNFHHSEKLLMESLFLLKKKRTTNYWIIFFKLI